MKTIKVREFTVVPGARYIKDGDGSAEEFFLKFVKPVMDATQKGLSDVEIDFDGTWGYASSFISELARRISTTYDHVYAKSYLSLKSDDEPSLVERFWNEFNRDYTK